MATRLRTGPALGNNYNGTFIIVVNLLCSGGTGQTGGTLSRQPMWQANPQTSHTTPCLVSPIMREVQCEHFSGDENVLTRNWWCDLDLFDKELEDIGCIRCMLFPKSLKLPPAIPGGLR